MGYVLSYALVKMRCTYEANVAMEGGKRGGHKGGNLPQSILAASAKESCIECVTEKVAHFCLRDQKVLSAKKILTIRVYILRERRFLKYVSENKQNFISG